MSLARKKFHQRLPFEFFNLKNVDVELPKNKFIVITGVSGSGKSSLTIDTLYAEGQRRYVESLSCAYWVPLPAWNKPDVDYAGLPAVPLSKVSTRTTRSPVGSLTEIYDYLRLLFARVGKTFSPISGEVVIKHEIRDVVDFVFGLPEGEKVYIYTTVFPFKKTLLMTWCCSKRALPV